MPNFRWACAKNGCYKDLCLPDWSILNDALAPCRMGDLDGFVERRGHFLVVEWKPLGKSVERAQERALSALNEHERFTVLIVHGLTDPMEPKTVRYPFGKDKPTNLTEFQEGVRRWFAEASSKKAAPHPGGA